MIRILNAILAVLAVAAPVLCQESLLYWGYECREAKCVKVNLNADNANSAVGLSTCRLYCGGKLGTVWPKPTGIVKIEQAALRIRTRIKYYIQSHANLERLWSENRRRFQSQINSKIPDPTLLRGDGGGILTVKILISQAVVEAAEIPSLRYDTDESYSLDISNANGNVFAVIKAKSFFGARHGLETLSQLIVYDEIRQELLVLSEAEITDAPVYKHRGVMLDTARNYFSIKAIKRTIDAMAMSKMNRFHWHIVDTSSFPLVIKSHPDLYMLGAYSPRKIYTQENIIDLVEYARARGVSIVPDFEGPGRAGEGWQLKNMTLCFNDQPWKNQCPSPPCGMFDPTNDELYSVFEDIYREIFEIFDLDVFNMGGSQVILGCWQKSEHVRNWMKNQGWGLEQSDFIKLWLHFQTNALNRFDKVTHNKTIPIILWADQLVGSIDSSRYIIQTFAARGSPEIKNALQKGHKVILSNFDALFLDCGLERTYGAGSDWCSPYKGWQTIYENRPKEIAGDKSNLILGAETANWAEQLGEHSLDARFWPRSSALAERLWSDPDENWRKAGERMLVHRERLIENGVGAEGLQPEWCLQNEDNCSDV